MANAVFTASAGQKIAKATKIVLGEPADKTGAPSQKRSYYSDTFPAVITDDGGTLGTPLQYAWSELNESGGSGTQAVKSGGRSGTTSVNYALNDYEVSGQQTIGHVRGPVRMYYSFDDAGNKYYRFFMLQLPLLAQYQGWFGTITEGATIVTINADYVRAI